MLSARVRRLWRRSLAQTRYAYYAHFNRRSARIARKAFGGLLLIVLFFVLYDFRQPEDRRLVKSDTLRNSWPNRVEEPRQSLLRIWPTWEEIDTIFAFGDSHSDTGFSVHGPQPDVENPLGNPGWPGRTTNYGPNFLGHMTATFNKTFIRTYVFANRNAPLIMNTDSLWQPSLLQQVEAKFIHVYGKSTRLTFKAGAGSGKWSQLESLFVIYFGSDELLHNTKERSGGRDEAAIVTNIEAYSDAMEKLYDAGARNFLLVNLPQLEEAPFMKTAGILNWIWDLGAEIVQYNGRLAFMAHRFAERHIDTNVFIFNNHNMSINVRREPTRFRETSTYKKFDTFCYPYIHDHWWTETHAVYEKTCKIPLDGYYWRDDMHFTEPYHRLMAHQIVDLLGNPSQRLPMEFY